MTSRPPIRVERKGWRKHFHPTLAELESACRYAEAEAIHIRFGNIAKLQDFIGKLVREQLQTNIGVEIDGEYIEDGDQLIAIWTGKGIGPAYIRIAMSQIGDEPIDSMDAAAKSIRNAVERMASQVKQGVKEIAEQPPLDLTRKTVPEKAHNTAQPVRGQSSSAQQSTPKPGVKARLDARSKPAPPRTQR